MKVGYVIHRFPWPSETFISREVADLIALGHDVEIYSFEAPGTADAALLTDQARGLMLRTKYIDRREAALALVAPAIFAMLGDERRLAATATSRVNRLLRLGRASALARRAVRDGVDRLQAHWPYATTCTHLASLASGLPYSVSIHAHEVAHDNGHFQVCFERLSFATFCNGAAMNYLLDRLPLAAREKSHLVYHGVDIGAFELQPPPEPGPPLRVLSAGRLTGSKGFDRLVVSCGEAHRRGSDVRLTILGRGPEEEKLRRLAEECDFADRLTLPGWVPHDEVRRFLREAHVFALMASDDFNDGLPNVVVEAMASGRPVVLSPLPAAREIIDLGRNGFILKTIDDTDGLIDALETLTRDGVAVTTAAAARATVEEKYDARIHIRTLSDLIEGIRP